MLIDTHAHISDKRFEADRAQSIERSKAAGVSIIIEIACEPEYWQKALDISNGNDCVYCAVGIHPQEARLCEPDVYTEMKSFAILPKIVAIGETGFDYHYENSPRAKQREVFLKHIELSSVTGKPLIIHCREAYPDLIEILKENKCHGVVHCFSGSPKEAEALLELGFYLGIDGPLTYPASSALREVVKTAPLERILIETDSPYLPPQQYRGKRNEPAYARFIAEKIASIREIDLGLVEKTTSLNASVLFGIGL
jgi:TatD DNase family protein